MARSAVIVESTTEADRVNAPTVRDAWREVRDRELRGVRNETRTRREAIEKMRRSFSKLCSYFLRIEGTTYTGWLKLGPRADWDEVIAAAEDEATWDRLVETFDTRRTGDA